MTIFERIIAREVPADIIYEDDLCLSFRDLNPQAPTHLLLVPKKCIPRIGEANEKDLDILGHLMTRISIIAEQEKFLNTGFRTVINHGVHGGETVPHLHIHILAGRPLLWPPG